MTKYGNNESKTVRAKQLHKEMPHERMT